MTGRETGVSQKGPLGLSSRARWDRGTKGKVQPGCPCLMLSLLFTTVCPESSAPCGSPVPTLSSLRPNFKPLELNQIASLLQMVKYGSRRGYQYGRMVLPKAPAELLESPQDGEDWLGTEP